MNLDVMKVISIIGTVLILGLILKDAGKFDTALTSIAKSSSTVISSLSAVG